MNVDDELLFLEAVADQLEGRDINHMSSFFYLQISNSGGLYGTWCNLTELECIINASELLGFHASSGFPILSK